MDFSPWLNLLTPISLLIVGLWLKNYLPSYFQEKGKLLAQKEDIAAITQKIEEVKVSFTKETETLKFDLQRLVSHEVSHRNEERNAIIDFFVKCNTWLYSYLEIPFDTYGMEQLQALREKRVHLEKYYAETNVARAKLHLLVKNEQIVNSSLILITEILIFKGWIDVRLLALQQNLETGRSLNERFMTAFKDLAANVGVAKEISANEEENTKKRAEIIEEYHAKRLPALVELFKVQENFTILVKDYLTK